MIEDSESQELLQIRSAASGMISGTLREWPHLMRAMRNKGMTVTPFDSARKAQVICSQWLEEHQND